MPYHAMNYSYLGKQVCHLPLILAGMFGVGGEYGVQSIEVRTLLYLLAIIPSSYPPKLQHICVGHFI